MRKATILQIVAGMAAIDVLTLLATWLLGGFAGLSAAGVGALIVGVTASFALGIGLMVAVFHSSRSGQDAAAHDAAKNKNDDG